MLNYKMIQNFYIKKDSDLPLLIMDTIDNNYFKYKDFDKYLLECEYITFSMYDMDGKCVLANKNVFIAPINNVVCENIPMYQRYHIVFKFKKKFTKNVGKYIGEFKFVHNSGDLILPINNQLIINIVE